MGRIPDSRSQRRIGRTLTLSRLRRAESARDEIREDDAYLPGDRARLRGIVIDDRDLERGTLGIERNRNPAEQTLRGERELELAGDSIGDNRALDQLRHRRREGLDRVGALRLY